MTASKFMPGTPSLCKFQDDSRIRRVKLRQAELYKDELAGVLDSHTGLERGVLRIETAVVLRVVGDLCPATPDDLAAGRDEPKLADVDLDDGSLCQDTELRVQRRVWRACQLTIAQSKRSNILGFFLTPRMGNCTVTPSSGCVTFAFLYRRPMGRIKRSYLTGLRVKSGPTNVGLVIMRFQLFLCVFLPVLTALNISSSLMPRTFGMGTLKRAAFSARLLLMALLSAFALPGAVRSRRYCGRGS